jgi:uncharacterized protein (DUF885 family)
MGALLKGALPTPPAFPPGTLRAVQRPSRAPLVAAARALSAARLCAPFALLAAACASPPPAPRPLPPPPLTAPAPPTATPTATHALASNDDPLAAALARKYLDFVVETSPETATALGIHTHDTELDDRAAAHEEALLTRERALLGEASALLAKGRLSRTAQTDVRLVEAALTVAVERRARTHPLQRDPQIYAAPMSAIFLMMARDYAPAAERATNALARIEKLPQSLAVARGNLTPKGGVTDAALAPPKVWTEVAMEMAASAAGFFDEQRAPLVAALPSEKGRVEQAIAGAKRAYAEYGQFLERSVLPRSVGSFAAGKAYFELLLARGYFLDEGADELLALGERILARTDAEMVAVARQIEPKAKGWPEIAARVKQRHPTAGELLASYRREVKRARDFLVQKDAVEFPPGDECDVVDTPAFLRATTTAAYDQPPPFDETTTKGLFFVTPIDRALPKAKQEEMLRENDFADQANTVVHEAYPGHHVQLSFARRHPSIARKMGDIAIFSEGWGLYSEELMAELGYYTPEERLMQLEWTLVRAARVVIDVGLHTRGMTFDDAVRLLTDRVHLERHLALSEVKRYTSTPTQPLSYLVGREAIFKLRERYKLREGATYTLRAFHTELLSHGTIPPGLIAREMFGD